MYEKNDKIVRHKHLNPKQERAVDHIADQQESRQPNSLVQGRNSIARTIERKMHKIKHQFP